jgi:hypothetical protein
VSTGASNRSAIGTLAERTARYVLLIHLPDNHTAEATSAGVSEAMSPLPAGLRRTLTWDRGSEMADHVQLAADLGTSIDFCEAHSPWHRLPAQGPHRHRRQPDIDSRNRSLSDRRKWPDFKRHRQAPQVPQLRDSRNGLRLTASEHS